MAVLRSRIVWAGILTLVATACDGGAKSLPAGTLGASGASERLAVTIRIVIPRRKHHRGLLGRYISASTKGMTIAFAGPSTLSETIGLTPSSPGCSSGAPIGTTCTVSALLKPCPSSANCYTGSVATYDNVSCVKTCTIPGGAHELSANQSVAFAVEPGKHNTIGLTLDGIPTSVAIVPGASSTLSGTSSSGFSISKCVIAPQNVSVIGIDAGGNQIVGAGAPASSLSSDDTVHLAVATPAPGASPNAFTLVPPSALHAATIPNASSVLHLTAGVTPLAGSGATAVSAQVKITFNRDVCGVITEFTTPTSNSQPKYIAAGPDGALWFTEHANNIGRITTGGTVTEYTVPTAGSDPLGITAGPDGNMWFTECFSHKVGRITMAGLTSETVVSPSGGLSQITTGSDGALWFAEAGNNKVGKVTTGGTVTQFTNPAIVSTSNGIAAGPDGALWFTDCYNNSIGRVTTAGTFTEVPIPTSSTQPLSIAAGPDGALWFTQGYVGEIGRITTSGTIKQFTVPTSGGGLGGITAGPDGALWFTECTGDKIGRITTAGTVTDETIPTSSSQPLGIATGPDGALWFTESGSSNIGRLQ